MKSANPLRWLFNATLILLKEIGYKARFLIISILLSQACDSHAIGFIWGKRVIQITTCEINHLN